MGNKKFLYTAKGGHLAVMSELLCRGWNVAIPEVDVGDDIFVVKHKDRDFHPVQVKYSIGKLRKNGRYTAQFHIPLIQLEEAKTPDLKYVFVVRLENKWKSFIIISRYDLYTKHTDKLNPIGSVTGTMLKMVHLNFSFANNALKCSKQLLTEYLDNWGIFSDIDDP